MNTQKPVLKRIHRLGQNSHAVIVAPSFVKSLEIDEMSFVTQELTPEGDGIVMRVRKLIPLEEMKEKETSALTEVGHSPGVKGEYG